MYCSCLPSVYYYINLISVQKGTNWVSWNWRRIKVKWWTITSQVLMPLRRGALVYDRATVCLCCPLQSTLYLSMISFFLLLNTTLNLTRFSNIILLLNDAFWYHWTSATSRVSPAALFSCTWKMTQRMNIIVLIIRFIFVVCLFFYTFKASCTKINITKDAFLQRKQSHLGIAVKHCTNLPC